MKDLWWAIRGALTIAAVLFVTFGAYVWWGMRQPGFRFPGPGHSDFSAHLAGDYSIYRTSGLNVVISPQGYGPGTPVIPNLVVECATDGRFIIAKRNGMKRRSPNDPKDTFEDRDPEVVDFWILDTQQPHVDGPLTEAEFMKLRRSLGISESVVLRDVYEYRHPEPDTNPSRKTSMNNPQGEQNGCRQRLEGYLSCQQRLALAVA
jgi:hypothetical protein